MELSSRTCSNRPAEEIASFKNLGLRVCEKVTDLSGLILGDLEVADRSLPSVLQAIIDRIQL